MIQKFTPVEDYNVSYVKRTLPITSKLIPHFHDYYELEIILSGTGKTLINGKEYPVKPGSVYLLTPADVHKYEFYEEVTLLNLVFVPKAIEYSLFMEKLYPLEFVIATLTGADLERLITYVEQIEKEISVGGQYSKKYVSLLLSCILIELYRHDEKDKKSCANTNPYYLPVQKALYYIRAHFKEDITLKSVSEFAGIPTATLSKKFPEHLGFGFKEYLVDLRLDYAKMLITNTNEQITDIAFYSGFNSLSYFQRVFMEKYGITPKNYRRENASAASNT